MAPAANIQELRSKSERSNCSVAFVRGSGSAWVRIARARAMSSSKCWRAVAGTLGSRRKNERVQPSVRVPGHLFVEVDGLGLVVVPDVAILGENHVPEVDDLLGFKAPTDVCSDLARDRGRSR